MDTTNLIMILKQVISKKKEIIKEFTKHIDPNLSKKMELLDKLRNDINEITKIDFNEINNILSLIDLKEEEKDKLQKDLDTIRVLLTLNEKEHTTYEIDQEEQRQMNLFLDKFDDYIEEQNKQKEIIGKLQDFNKENIILELEEGKLLNIDRKNISQIKTVYNWDNLN